ncbi:hypothetical protein RchiOBHm_Chr3g0478121 [Rosa chinensis]|uniref:Uncharacterized protein n=1 Tax=Rosa chinensis TaxID=74649 RepID=A0A2P6RD36_ROSCH|nr:hypothetical protein RchiOBHm_Chr3g0478121 [Rosa chinensis]
MKVIASVTFLIEFTSTCLTSELCLLISRCHLSWCQQEAHALLKESLESLEDTGASLMLK